MKILLFIDSLGPGGAQRQIVNLAELLKRSGSDVSLCYYYDIDFYGQLLDEGDIARTLLTTHGRFVSRLLSVIRYFRKVKPDCVISYLETPSVLSCFVKILWPRFNLIVSERNTTQRLRMRDYIRFCLYHWADAIVPNSYSQARFMIDECGWMAGKLSVITNCVDLDKFNVVEHRRNIVQEILVVGSISESKNTKRFIHACYQLKQKGIFFHVIWVGWMEPASRYMLDSKQLVNDMGLDDVFTFETKTLDIVPYYHKCDILCLPSIYEGTPNVLCEAIACGLPVVAGDICDNNLYAIEGRNAFLFNPMSVEDMASALNNMLSVSEVDYQRYRNESRTIAEDRLAPSFFCDEYNRIIKSL